jgi:magnesium-transporting ATPase (P-type)
MLGYATPVVYAGGQWQEGKVLVIAKDSTFLPCCVKCGGESDGRPWRKTYWWHHQAIFLIALFNILIYAIVAMCVRKSAKVQLNLCAHHRARRQKWLLITWLTSLTSLASIIGGFVFLANAKRSEEYIGGLVVAGGVVLLILAVVFGNVFTPILKPKKIDKHFAWFTGAGPAYLEQLPLSNPH